MCYLTFGTGVGAHGTQRRSNSPPERDQAATDSVDGSAPSPPPSAGKRESPRRLRECSRVGRAGESVVRRISCPLSLTRLRRPLQPKGCRSLYRRAGSGHGELTHGFVLWKARTEGTSRLPENLADVHLVLVSVLSWTSCSYFLQPDGLVLFVSLPVALAVLSPLSLPQRPRLKTTPRTLGMPSHISLSQMTSVRRLASSPVPVPAYRSVSSRTGGSWTASEGIEGLSKQALQECRLLQLCRVVYGRAARFWYASQQSVPAADSVFFHEPQLQKHVAVFLPGLPCGRISSPM